MKGFRGEGAESTGASAADSVPTRTSPQPPRDPRHEDNPKYLGPVPGPMRGPYSDYAPPPIYITKDRSGPRPGVRFSRTELFQLLVAILALSAALTLANVSASRGLIGVGQLGLVIGLWFVSALVAVSTGVGLHEISHKIVAQRFGHWAEFRYSLRGLAMAFVFAFFGFLLAAAAIVRTASVTNVVAFLITTILVFAWYMNVILAGFNMIPILPFDGAKVWVWNKGVYVGLVVLLYLAGVNLGITAL